MTLIITDNDNGTVGTNDNVQATSNVNHGTVQHLLPQNTIDTSVRPKTYANVVTSQGTNNILPTHTVTQTPKTYANVVRTSSPTNFSNSQANISMRPNDTFIQPTVVRQQSVQSIPTQIFYSQLPQVQQTSTIPNFNQGPNATPIYLVDRPAVREQPCFKHRTLEQFNKYLVSFERHCA
ncbi:unnamed protein product [Rotaria socialis]|uniref:Uncharacterized protein n=1 Tax=Rotaria socialis TaxID=392032 RepID=A0A821W3X8_9BILA|nr:unnamed protein product [Rotaria socialis]CAF4917752.1 unnamed protein product [Rotaria socialis]